MKPASVVKPPREVGATSRWPPLALAVPFVLALSFVVLPLAGLLWKAPWSHAVDDLTTSTVGTALRLSLVCSLGAMAISALLGVPLAWVLARIDIPGRSLLRALTMLPMVLPPVVGGVALLLAFGRNGLVGQWLYRATGYSLPFTTAGAMLAEAFVAMPFLVLTVEAGLRSADRRLEDAAATLGANRWTTFRRVTIPMVAPSLFAGLALAWARALGEFGATITFAGNFPGTTQTVPLAVYVALESQPDVAIVLSLLLLAFSVVVLVSLRDRWFPAR
ncbi:MAG TPA: ABC transporter permease [Actinomycetota bacterium]|nr:ABC transporter permease [Actinomycetota bacterium]